MSELVDHLAEMTGFRDRDVLDVTLVTAFQDLLQPQCVGVYRLVEDEGAQRWMTRARLARGQAAATADPAWGDLDGLPLLDECPERRDCLQRGEILAPPGPQHRTLFPVATDREVVGVLEIDSEAPLSAEHRRMVMSILRIYRNFQGLLDYSERDTLTGLLNRKTFDETFLKTALACAPAAAPAQPERRREADACWWLGLIDIDHFKRVNDSHGHLIGDEVLLLLSRLMRSSFRFHDQLYRFGGEEFVVLLRCNGDEEAALALERFRANTEAYRFTQVGRVTVSIGFTRIKPTDTPSAAFERADKAVYWAKGHGRNQVCSHAALIKSGELAEDSHTGDMELF